MFILSSVQKISKKAQFETKFIQAFKGIDLSKRRLPLMILRGQKDGPVIWLCGAIHGDEVTGTEVIDRVFSYLRRYGLERGTIYSFPVMNPLGFEIVTRYYPFGEEDLNRKFPGDPNGTTGERLAYTIFQEIIKTKPALVIDLHTDSLRSIAYSIIDHVESPKKNQAVAKSVEFAKKFSATWVFETPDYDPPSFERMFSGALVRAGIPAFTSELGGPMIVNEDFVQIGFNGILNILQDLEMIKTDYVSSIISSQSIPLKLLKGATSDAGGILEYKVKAGEFIKKGKILARVKNVFGATEDILRFDGAEKALVLGLYDSSVVFPGAEIVTLATPFED